MNQNEETTYHFWVEEKFVETIWSVKAASEEEAQEKLFDRASNMPKLMSSGDITLHSRDTDETEVEPITFNSTDSIEAYIKRKGR